MTGSKLLIVHRGGKSDGTDGWHRQPILSILRGVVSDRHRTAVRQDAVDSYDPQQVWVTYAVTRDSVEIGKVQMSVRSDRLVVDVFSVHDRDNTPVFTWKWTGKSVKKGMTPDGRKAMLVIRNPRPKFRRLGTRIRKALLTKDDAACVEQVMES